jgi:predicted RNase H-like HicB family nuclease
MEAYYAAFIPGESGKISVIFPDVPGCATQGDTMAHALAMAIDALAGHLEAMADDGDIIPDPSDYEVAWEAFRKEFAGYGLGPIPEGTLLHQGEPVIAGNCLGLNILNSGSPINSQKMLNDLVLIPAHAGLLHFHAAKPFHIFPTPLANVFDKLSLLC